MKMKMSIVQRRQSDMPCKWGIWEEEEAEAEEEKQNTRSQHGGAHKQERNAHKPEHIRIIIMEYLRALYRASCEIILLCAVYQMMECTLRIAFVMSVIIERTEQRNENNNRTKQWNAEIEWNTEKKTRKFTQCFRLLAMNGWVDCDGDGGRASLRRWRCRWSHIQFRFRYAFHNSTYPLREAEEEEEGEYAYNASCRTFTKPLHTHRCEEHTRTHTHAHT